MFEDTFIVTFWFKLDKNKISNWNLISIGFKEQNISENLFQISIVKEENGEFVILIDKFRNNSSNCKLKYKYFMNNAFYPYPNETLFQNDVAGSWEWTHVLVQFRQVLLFYRFFLRGSRKIYIRWNVLF